MNTDWHDLIQRYIAGLTTDEESAFLQEALKRDDALARLYLRYMNLDVALEARASLEDAAHGVVTTHPMPAANTQWPRWVSWGPLAAVAACVALLLSSWLMSHFRSSRVERNVAATIASAQQAIAQISVETPSPLPAWMSPTASMLDQPRLPQ
jgi:anti-sigma factor RsiW